MGGIVDPAMLAAREGAAAVTGGTSEIIAQLLNLIPSIFQGITGASQLRKASLLEKQNVRPKAEIAPSVNELVNYNYGRTLATDVPGGEMYRGEIKGATAAGLRAASELKEGAEGFGLMGELVGREQNQFGELAKITAGQVKGAEGDYANSLLAKADEEKRVEDWNKFQPYLQAAQIAQQLRDSGLRNINSGVKNIFGSGAEYVSSMNQNQDFNSSLMWGKGNSGKVGEGMSDQEFADILKKAFGKV